VKITWYDGGLGPERPAGLSAKEGLPARGVLFVGDKGALSMYGQPGRPEFDWKRT